jgi:hypothetical protein
MTLDNILNKSIFVENFGNIYPVKLKNWDEFELNLNPVILGKDHIPLNIEDDFPLLDRLFALGRQDENVFMNLCKVFNIIAQSQKFQLLVGEQDYVFVNENNQIINRENYDGIRQIILQQNILFEPKIYKNPTIKKWAEKVLASRGKNAPNVTLEDKLSTVSVFSGKHYWELADYTMYQLNYDFNRICKVKNYDTQSMMFANPYADLSKFKLEHFAENINMYENPYDGIFKETSSLSKINGAISS